ncbi:MAG: hypothetical protein CVU32_02490 [Betaproteobacteria bacterium HGW-Betaproteobacteria-5]|jgi:hypothetical protein|nr:MAG: hypothetical protein CVU32_02490 [Betaproteobacteria bacterium HGW-Betaproteobacteria-5]PKO39165.1 MAG: hypothetical protein CVU33_06100 [Betaproteobacteria bacterium HGW-Betaproteobacteria-6]
MSDIAGRTCPLRYRYGAEAIARLPAIEAETLYVVGGLYGNLPALDAIEAMVAQEDGPVTLVFNGDFNWFNVDDAGFAEINRRVLAHHAIVGNVEAELGVDGNAAGCGCAYPEHVDSAVVERSNWIHARLKETASRQPAVLERLAVLPMIARFQVGATRIGIVHGDAESLAGWRFDVAALNNPDNHLWIIDVFRRAEVNIFACTHTCLPALCRFPLGETTGVVINNGAAGMPNFKEQRYGLLTRISTRQPTGEVLYGKINQGVHAHALPIRYDHDAWRAAFLANWPEGSPAWLSYYQRIMKGPNFVVTA